MISDRKGPNDCFLLFILNKCKRLSLDAVQAGCDAMIGAGGVKATPVQPPNDLSAAKRKRRGFVPNPRRGVPPAPKVLLRPTRRSRETARRDGAAAGARRAPCACG